MPALENIYAAAAVTSAASGYCPHCGKAVENPGQNPWRPFCSERCKMGDLGAWFAERYVIPEDEEREAPEDQEPRQ